MRCWLGTVARVLGCALVAVGVLMLVVGRVAAASLQRGAEISGRQDQDPAAAALRSPLDGAGELEVVAEGFQFLEGPQWIPAEGVLLFLCLCPEFSYALAYVIQ